VVHQFRTWLDARIGLEVTSEQAECLLQERAIAIRKQLPWLYGMLLVRLCGLAFATLYMGNVTVLPPILLAGWVLLRVLGWLRTRTQDLSVEAVQRELRRHFVIACLYFSASLCWDLIVCLRLSPIYSADVSAFSCLAGIAAAYVLTNVPALSRIPLLLIAFPLALITCFTSDVGDSAIGVSLLIFSLLSWRILNIQNATFERLVLSRLAVETEKRRAIRAEHVAIAEQTRVAQIANTDPLTGLANRRGFLTLLERVAPDQRKDLALVLIDLDGFKPVNDTFGHAAGDLILRQVGRRLMLLQHQSVQAARLGGDEFALVFDCDSPETALSRTRAIVDELCRPFLSEERTMRISACAGISYQRDADVDEAMRRADLALYDAKRSGRGSVILFSLELEQEVQRRTAIEQALRDPRLTDDISLRFQPIFDLQSGMLSSFESLARWKHSELGWVSPSEFIPITEQISVLEAISDELLGRAAAVASQWPAAVGLSFNVSGVQLCSAGTATKLLAIAGAQGLDPRRLQIEVTETALLADFDLARQNLAALRAAGAKIYLDDFGAGFASISYLREIEFDAIKIDGSLTRLATADGNASVLRGVLALCDAMGQECVAEHLETDEQLALMRELGCRFGQGYVLSRPLDAAAAARLAAPQVVPLRRKPATAAR
jgi:diguanylate cyclase (GGDEF)-like protein